MRRPFVYYCNKGSAGFAPDCAAIPQPEGWGSFTPAYTSRQADSGRISAIPNRKVGDLSLQPIQADKQTPEASPQSPNRKVGDLSLQPTSCRETPSPSPWSPCRRFRHKPTVAIQYRSQLA